MKPVMTQKAWQAMRARHAQQRAWDHLQAEVQFARDICKQCPDVRWSEALRIASRLMQRSADAS